MNKPSTRLSDLCSLGMAPTLSRSMQTHLFRALVSHETSLWPNSFSAPATQDKLNQELRDFLRAPRSCGIRPSRRISVWSLVFDKLLVHLVQTSLRVSAGSARKITHIAADVSALLGAANALIRAMTKFGGYLTCAVSSPDKVSLATAFGGSIAEAAEYLSVGPVNFSEAVPLLLNPSALVLSSAFVSVGEHLHNFDTGDTHAGDAHAVDQAS